MMDKAAMDKIAELQAEVVALGNLLAIIHRDGGQHQDDVGTALATKEAVEIVSAYRTQLDDQQAEIKRLKEDNAYRMKQKRIAQDAMLDMDAELSRLKNIEKAAKAWMAMRLPCDDADMALSERNLIDALCDSPKGGEGK